MTDEAQRLAQWLRQFILHFAPDALSDRERETNENLLAIASLLEREAPRPREPDQKILSAARNADWGQVVANGGPPCFHMADHDTRFCLRAERWQGHDAGQIHRFVSLDELLARTLEGVEREAPKDAPK